MFDQQRFRLVLRQKQDKWIVAWNFVERKRNNGPPFADHRSMLQRSPSSQRGFCNAIAFELLQRPSLHHQSLRILRRLERFFHQPKRHSQPL
jgi:hypothetical protein